MSEDNTRKATDVLISIESKLESLLNHHKSQDLNLKILSNKLNTLVDALPKLIEATKEKPAPPKFTVEIADSAPQLTKINSDSNIKLEVTPQSDRRASRDSDDYFRDYDDKSLVIEKKIEAPVNKVTDKIVQVTQRIIDKNQKSIFLADVEIKSLGGDFSQKAKTNSVGKWSANLSPGQYRVSISKRESNTRQKIDVTQDISVDENKSIQILSDLIVK